MNINRDELRALSELSDSELWEKIGKIAREHGYTLGDISPSQKDLERIRGALRGSESLSMRDAARILNTYKKKR